jgi:hypothetical protein
MSENRLRLPYHKWLVGAIKGADVHELLRLGAQMREVVIPKGHDEIISVWEERAPDLKREGRGMFSDIVLSDLQDQKRIAGELRGSIRKEKVLDESSSTQTVLTAD